MSAREPRIYRRNVHRITFAATYAGLAAVGVLLAVSVHPAFALVTPPLLVLTWRTFRVGVVADANGVTVRNVCRDRRFAWARVARFDWGSWWGFPIGGVWLVDGSFVRAWALNPPFETKRGQNPAVPRALAGLNAELAATRDAVPGEGAGAPEAPRDEGTQLRLGD